MKTLAVTLLFSIISLFTANVNAEDLTGKVNDQITLTISDQPCDNSVVPLIKPEFLDRFQRGSADFDGKPLDICWTSDEFLLSTVGASPRDFIFVVDSEAGHGLVPVEIFKQGYTPPANPNSF